MDSRDGRYAKPIMAAVVAGVLLATAAAVPVLLNTVSDSTTPADATSQQTQAASPAPSPPTESEPSTATSTSPQPAEIASATAMDPDGDGQENNSTADRAFDGDPESEWRTERYDSQDNVGGRKVGVGLALRLEEPSTVNGVRVQGRSGQNFTVYTNDSETLDGATEIGQVENAGDESDVAAESPAEDVQYVIVLLTRLPEEDGSYRGGLSEIEVY